MADVAVVPRVSVEGVLLEPKAGGIRLKVRGGAAIHIPWESAAEVARELGSLAEAAGRVRP